MKRNVTTLVIATLMMSSAFAEDASNTTTQEPKGSTTVTTTTVLASAEEAGTNKSTALEKSPIQATAIEPEIKYTGFFYGPGLDFSGAHTAANNERGDMYLHNRPKFFVKAGDDFEAGIETRFNILFNSANTRAANDNYRLVAIFNNVYKTDTFNIGIIPRIDLPTSNASHVAGMLPSPELIGTWAYTPKNTRFSLNGGLIFLKAFYQQVPGSDYTKAGTFEVQPWVELDYQLTPKIAPYVAYWPDATAHGHQNAPLAMDSDEVDLGVSFDVGKGWAILPFVAVEPYGMTSASPLSNMQANVIFSGKVF